MKTIVDAGPSPLVALTRHGAPDAKHSMTTSTFANAGGIALLIALPRDGTPT